MAANLINWLYNIYLNRVLSLDDYSQVAAILNCLLIISGFAVSIQYAATKFLPYVSRQSPPLIDDYHNSILSISLYLGIGLSALAWITLPFWSAYLHLSTAVPVNLLLAAALIFFILLSAVKGLCLGWRLYIYTGLLLLCESMVKFAVAIVGFRSGQTLNIGLIAIPISMFISLVFGLIILARRGVGFRLHINITWAQKILRFAAFSFITTMGAQLLLFTDVIIVRHNFSPFQAGIYATISLIGKMIFFYFIYAFIKICDAVNVE